MSKPKTMIIDDVKYIRADSVPKHPYNVDGMDYVIVRSREQGVMCGYLKSINRRTVTLYQARQIWKYDSSFVLPDIAEKGMRNPDNAMLSVAMSQPMIMLEACGVLTCTEMAAKQLIDIPAQDKK